jgi:Angiotensin-converting enzyme
LGSRRLRASPRNERWWEYVSKTHLNDTPAYYYNYAVATVLKFQVNDYIARKILHQPPQSCNYAGNKEVGGWLYNIMKKGDTENWRKVLEDATGENLSTRRDGRIFQAAYGLARGAKQWAQDPVGIRTTKSVGNTGKRKSAPSAAKSNVGGGSGRDRQSRREPDDADTTGCAMQPSRLTDELHADVEETKERISQVCFRRLHVERVAAPSGWPLEHVLLIGADDYAFGPQFICRCPQVEP